MTTPSNKLWWVLIVALAVPVVDRAIDAFYVAHTTNEAVVRGHDTARELDQHPETRLLVIGDSSARHGVDAEVLTNQLGMPVWNIGTWHGAFAGQATLIDELLNEEQSLEAILIVTTENGMALPIGHEAEEVVMLYYLSPHALSLWAGMDKLSATRAMEWSWALASPSYRDGKGLETFALSLFQRNTWNTLRAQGETNRKQSLEYAAHRGQGKLAKRPQGPGMHQFAYFQQVILENAGYRWNVHPEVQEWYDVLCTAADRRNVKVFHLFTPRYEKLLAHPRWAPQVGEPTRAWAKLMREKHPSFILPFPDPIGMRADEYADTTDHLDQEGAARFSAIVAEGLKPYLSK